MKKEMIFRVIPFVVAAISPSVMRSAESADSVTTRTLSELVVRSDRSWVEGDKAVFIPTKSEKNLSNDPASLIKNMHIPSLLTEGTAIRTIYGDEVAVYINGVKADGIDLKTFWPKQTKRVEYLQRPSDPRFAGEAAVINFIMSEYEMGGITKMGADQIFPNQGDYSIASKLVYKRMTFGALVKGGYERDHQTSSVGEDHYHDVWYEGVGYNDVTEFISDHSVNRNDYAAAAVNARYQNGGTRLTHTLALTWDRNPESGYSGFSSWSPSIFDEGDVLSRNRLRSLTPQLSGDYYLKFNSSWTMGIKWNYAHSHNNSSSFYRLGELFPILNWVREDVNDGEVVLNPSVRISKKHTVAMYVKSKMDWYSTGYSGSADLVQNQWRGSTLVSLCYYWRPNSHFYLTFLPGMNITYWRVGGLSSKIKTDPRISASFRWTPSRKFSLTLAPTVYSTNPSASQSADVMIQQSELIWLVGNPDLRSSNFWRPDLYFTWNASDCFRLWGSAYYSHSSDETASVYRSGGNGLDGLLRKYVNIHLVEHIGWDAGMTLSLLDNNLVVDLQPTWRRYVIHGEYGAVQSWFRMRGSIAYTLGNFQVTVDYGGPEKWLDNGGMRRVWKNDHWNVGITYGNGNFYVEAALNNIFHNKRHIVTEVNSGDFVSFRDTHSLGRNFSLSLGYTFGYGKKIDKSINVALPQEIGSAAIGAE